MQRNAAITLLTILSAIASLAISHSSGADPEPTLSSVLSQWDNDEHPDLKAVIVLRNGQLVAERYYNGEKPSSLHDVRSAGKSITSLLMGVAFDQKRVSSLDDPVERYWPEAHGSTIGDVAIKDVLTMRSGLAAFDADSASPGNEDKMDASASPSAFILNLPRSDAPGSAYRYNSVTAHVAGLIVEKAVHGDLQMFAEASLFRPLGIEHWSWQKDADGHYKGEGNLSLTARDFSKIGELVLENGFHDGKQVISSAWLAAALAPRVAIGVVDAYADAYGYFWYRKRQFINGRPIDVSFASGNGGNKIYVVRQLELVVAITSSAYGKGYGQRRSEDILKAVLSFEERYGGPGT